MRFFVWERDPKMWRVALFKRGGWFRLADGDDVSDELVARVYRELYGPGDSMDNDLRDHVKATLVAALEPDEDVVASTRKQP